MGQWGSDPGAVTFPDGRRVRGTSIRASRGHAEVPEFAVYLLGRDPHITQWPNRWVRWRDFSSPASTQDTVDALRQAHAQAATERVEIACGAGIGRTGTALTVLAIISGVPATHAVDWVRATYHARAVETRRQRAWVTSVASSLT